MNNGNKIHTRQADVSPTLDYRSFVARQRARQTVRLGRTLIQASCEMNKKIDSMLLELEFRTVIMRAEEDIRQKGLGLIAESFKKGRKPSTRELSGFLSEIETR